MNVTAALVVALVLVAVNAFFVMAEFAVVGAPRATIDKMAADGLWTARLAQKLLRHPKTLDRYLATSQLGVTVASIGLGYLEEAFSRFLAPHLTFFGDKGVFGAHAVSSAIVLAALTVLHIVLGEMVPKSLSLQQGEHAILRVAPFMTGLYHLVAPLVWVLNHAATCVLALFGIHRDQDQAQGHTAQELEVVVRESQEGGQLENAAGVMLQEIFDFGDLTAGEVMAPRTQIVGLEVGATVDEVRQVVMARRFSRYPIFDGDLDHIVSVAHIKQLLSVLLSGRRLTAKDGRKLAFVPQTAPLGEVLRAMRREHTQVAVVMDEFGGTAGWVTTDDLSAEIIGDVAVGKEGPVTIEDAAPGKLVVKGTARLDDLSEHLDKPLEREDVDTVSGLVLTLLNRPAQVGDEVRYDGLVFRVTALEGRGVDVCEVTEEPSDDVGSDAESDDAGA